MRFAAIGFAVATVTWVASSRSNKHEHMSINVGHEKRAESAGGPERQSERWSWRGRVASGKTIEIRGVSGDVVAEPAEGSEVEVSAVKRGRRSDPEDVRLEVVEHDDGVTICAVYPGNGNRCYAGGSRNNTRNNDVKVDFTVRVPRGVSFSGHTVNGDVEANNMTGDVDVASVNGDVRLETQGGNASGQSVNGGVTAILHSAGDRDLRFTSVNGSVNVTLPASVSAEVEARTVNGSIDTDFPIMVRGRMSPRNLVGAIGRGGRKLDLNTVNGSIRLRKLP